MQASEKLFLQEVGRFVGERLRAWTAPIVERIAKIEAAIAHTQEPRTFSQADRDAIRLVVVEVLKDALATERIASLDDVEEAVAQIPAGPPGKDGRDGRDGTDCTDAATITDDWVRSLVADSVSAAIAALPTAVHLVDSYIDRAGDLHLTHSDGRVSKVGHVVGKDADPQTISATIEAALKAACEKYPPPKDGKDGFGLTDFSLEFDGQRTFTATFVSGDIKKEFNFKVAVPLYRDVWRDGAYEKGDVVTHEGSTWIALEDTSNRPGTLNSGWRLSVKRGRDGKSIQGPQGQQGFPGRDGRDLTQLGLDGRKW